MNTCLRLNCSQIKLNLMLELVCDAWDYHYFIYQIENQLKIEVKLRETAQNTRLITYALFATNSIWIYAKKALDFGKFRNEFYENLRN